VIGRGVLPKKTQHAGPALHHTRSPLPSLRGCLINRLKQWRGIATRYEKTATVHLAGLRIAGILLWSAR
jgi:transposase